MNNTTTTATAPANSVPTTIAQGLRRAKKLKGLLVEAQNRATGATSWVAGKKPVFDFAEQRAQRAALQDEIVRIETAVAVANATNTITVGGQTMTLARAIRTLQEVKADLAWLPQLNLRAGLEESTEYVYDEDVPLRRKTVKTSVTYEAVMDEPARVGQIQALRDRFEAINDALETANHRTRIEVEPAQAPSPSAKESAA